MGIFFTPGFYIATSIVTFSQYQMVCFINMIGKFIIMFVIDLMHNDIARIDAREECWS